MYSRKTELAVDIAMEFLGRPYVWGGDNPVTGFDCSGFIIEILKSVGILPAQGDWTANDLMEMFKDRVTQIPSEGCLVFYGQDKASHVEMVIADINKTIFTIGANSRDAFINIRPTKTNSIMTVNPFWET